MVFGFGKSTMKCTWCGNESSALPYSKRSGGEELRFCSKLCKKAFRAKQNKKSRVCPSCALR